MLDSGARSPGSSPDRGHCVAFLVTWPMNASEAAGDLILSQTSLLFSCKFRVVSIKEQLDLHNKSHIQPRFHSKARSLVSPGASAIVTQFSTSQDTKSM